MTQKPDDSQSIPYQANIEEAVAADLWPAQFPRPAAIAELAERILAQLASVDQLNFTDSGKIRFAVTVVIQDDAGIAEINQEFRQKDRPTDVLSFPMFDFPAGPGTCEIDLDLLRRILNEWPTPEASPMYHVGDVVISFETCQKQATEIGHSLLDEFQRLLVHGILHLFGYDHETSAADETCMRVLEDRLLSALDSD